MSAIFHFIIDYSCIIYIFLKIGIHDEHYLSTDEVFTCESEFCNLETKVKQIITELAFCVLEFEEHGG